VANFSHAERPHSQYQSTKKCRLEDGSFLNAASDTANLHHKILLKTDTKTIMLRKPGPIVEACHFAGTCYRPFLSAIGDLPFCRLGIAPPGPKVRIAVLILATSSGDSPYARQPQSEANGKSAIRSLRRVGNFRSYST
jgi:hypothetical protein